MKKNSTGLARNLLPGIIAAMFLSPIAATASPSPLPLNDKINNLETILTHAAREKIDQAEFSRIYQLLEEAEAALKKQDQAAAEKLYAQAWDAYHAAVKASQAQEHRANDKKNLAAKIASVKALLKQYEEIDKTPETKKTEQVETVKSLLTQAEADEDPAKGRALANQAYYMMKILVKDVRGGKTLTFDHTFATPALKYADEAAYNDMHFGLLDTALQQLKTQPDAEYNELVTKAKKLREEAEEAAEHSDYESAMRDLGLSTLEIKKALKHLGLAVPGL